MKCWDNIMPLWGRSRPEVLHFRRWQCGAGWPCITVVFLSEWQAKKSWVCATAGGRGVRKGCRDEVKEEVKGWGNG